MPQPGKLSLMGKLDNGLSRFTCRALIVIKTGLLWLTGLMILALLPFLIFEYGEGLADISLLEWGFMVLMCLLMWRHVHYCQHFSTGFWRGGNRLLISLGVLAVVELIVIGLCEIFLWQSEYEDFPKDYLLDDDPYVKLATYATLLIALYLSVPTTAHDTVVNEKHPAEDSSNPSDNTEPMTRDTFKEPTL